MRVRPGEYLRLKALKGASLGYAPALATTFRIGWKGLPATRTLAYYEHYESTALKGFITLSSGPKIIKLFTSVFTNVRDKLECLPLVSLSSQVKCLWVTPRAYPKEELLLGAPLG